jgi:hypothetical protein
MTPPLSADLEEERGIRSFIAEIVNVKNVPVVLPIIKILSSVPCHTEAHPLFPSPILGEG